MDELIRDGQRNNAQAQEQIYRLFGSKLFAVCLKYSRNHTEAEDHFQDGFILIFEKISQYNFQGSFEGWMKRVMINNILQHYRKLTPLDYHQEDVTDQDIELEDEEIPMDYLLSIIQELPHRYRMVFNLYVIDGFSHKEIAQMLEITTGTSKSNLARARMILKEKIENYKAKKFPSAL